VAPRAQAATNLLSNAGFEQPLADHPWMPAAWDTSISGLDWVFFGRDSMAARTGGYGVHVANVSMRIPMAHNWSQTLIVGPEAWGKDLVFSIWSRTMGLEGRAYVLLQAYRDTVSKMSRVWNVGRDEAMTRLKINKIDDPSLDLGWDREYFSEPESDWTERKLRVFVPTGTNMVYIRIGLLGTGQALFDDASLTLEPAAPPEPLPLMTNLLQDPGFEGDGNQWEYSLPPYEGVVVARDTTVAHSGRASLRLEGTNGLIKTRAGVCQVFANRDLAGKRIRVSGWVKTDSLRSFVISKVYAHGPEGVKAYPGLRQVSGTTPWTKITMDLDVPVGAYSVWVWYFYQTPAEGRAWVDDTSVQVVGPAEYPEGMQIPGSDAFRPRRARGASSRPRPAADARTHTGMGAVVSIGS
jgi:hypothetical protein